MDQHSPEHEEKPAPESTEDRAQAVALVDTVGDSVEDIMQDVPGGPDQPSSVPEHHHTPDVAADHSEPAGAAPHGASHVSWLCH